MHSKTSQVRMSLPVLGNCFSHPQIHFIWLSVAFVVCGQVDFSLSLLDKAQLAKDTKTCKGDPKATQLSGTSCLWLLNTWIMRVRSRVLCGGVYPSFTSRTETEQTEEEKVYNFVILIVAYLSTFKHCHFY